MTPNPKMTPFWYIRATFCIFGAGEARHVVHILIMANSSQHRLIMTWHDRRQWLYCV